MSLEKFREMFSGHCHAFDTGIAAYFDCPETAIVLNHILFWLRNNKLKEKNQIDGRTWMFETAKEISEHLGYMTEKVVGNCIRKLLESGLLIKAEYNTNKFDRTAWYAIANEDLLDVKKRITKFPNGNLGVPDRESPQSRLGTSLYTDIKQDIKQDKHKKEPAVADSVCVSFGSHVKLKSQDYEQFAKDLGKEFVDDMISEMNDYCGAHGKKYKDYASALRQWIRRKKDSPPSKKINNSISNQEVNKKFAEKCEKNYMSKYYRIDVLGQGVEIVPLAGMAAVQTLNYSENGFEDQLTNMLRKKNFFAKKATE